MSAKERQCKECGKSTNEYSDFWEGEFFSDCDLCGATYHHPCRETHMRHTTDRSMYLCIECFENHELMVKAGVFLFEKLSLYDC